MIILITESFDSVNSAVIRIVLYTVFFSFVLLMMTAEPMLSKRPALKIIVILFFLIT